MTAIIPCRSDEADKLKFHDRSAADSPADAADAVMLPGGILDRIKFIRISMLTDPALDAGRHEFELRTLLGTGAAARKKT